MTKTLVATPDFEQPKQSHDHLRIKAATTLSNAIESQYVSVMRSEIVTKRIGDQQLDLPSFFIGLEFNAVSDRNTIAFELGRRVTFLEDLNESQPITMPVIRRSVFEKRHRYTQAPTFPNAQKYKTFAPLSDGFKPTALEPTLPFAPELALQKDWSADMPNRALGPLALNMAIEGTNLGYDITFLEQSSLDRTSNAVRRIQRAGGNAYLTTDERLPDNERGAFMSALDLITETIAAHSQQP